MRERVTTWAYLLGWKVVCRLPQRWAEWAFGQVADWAWRRQGPTVRQLEANLSRVARRASPDAPATDLRFVAFRESLGMEVLPHSGGASRFGQLARRLRAGGLVCLLCERDLTGSGIEVEFFGEPARMMGGPAALAVHTGAALMPVTLWYRGPYWCARIHPEIAVPGGGDRGDKVTVMTQQLARVFEAAVAAHPEDWHMLRKVFVADLDPERMAGRQGEADGAHEGPPATPGGGERGWRLAR